ncbi:MAG: alginate lyase family protein [Verrucomicrobiota bacterium]
MKFTQTCSSSLLLTLLAGHLPAAEPWLLQPAELPGLAQHAPAALTAPITTVVEGESLPGGDPHDYISYARYWWPDPARPGGLPYVQRDGRHNHAQVAAGDRHRVGTFSAAVLRLAAAWHLHRAAAAARRAGAWLRAWYLDPATRMNPNLDFAQVRLGHNGNRGNPAGVLDTRDFASVIDALRLLADSPALSAEEHTAIRAWFARYLDWLLNAPNARAERAAQNNHGTWYFAHIIPVARFVGRDDLARELVLEARDRIAQQIRPDGSQPEEIRRVDGLGYSRFNLEAWFAVARHARGLGFDLWNFTAPNGASLPKALEFLRPYNAAPEKWPHPQKEKLAPGFLDPLLAQAAEFSAQPPIPTKPGSVN